MDEILHGLFMSKHPESLKQKIFQRILDSPKKPQETIPILNLAIKLCLDGQTAFLCTSGVKLYEIWAKDNEDIFQNYFTLDFMNNILIEPHENPTAAIVIMEKSLKILRNRECYALLVKYFHQLITPFLKLNNNLQCLDIIFSLITKHAECVPVFQTQRFNFCCVILDILYVNKMPKQGNSCFLHEVKTIKSAGKILIELWDYDDDTRNNSIHHLFSLISQPYDKPSICLGTLCQLPIKSVEKIINLINTDVIDKDRLSNAIYQIIHWLEWPFSQGVDIWIKGIFQKVDEAGLTDVLKEITEKAIIFVTSMLKPVASRESAVNILVHMYTKIHISPDHIYQVIMALVNTLPVLAEEKSSNGLTCIEILVDNMELEIYWRSKVPFIKYKHMNYFSVKELELTKAKPIAALCNIKTYTVPTIDIQKTLLRKTGLCNVKNSCYMNTIIQVLFMLDNFREEVLALPAQPGGIISKLQEVFSYLLFSQRPAFYPSEFYRYANPSWFVKYEQQDCAEFLSHFLNVFDEEEKKYNSKTLPSKQLIDKDENEQNENDNKTPDNTSQTLIDKTFFGKLRNCTLCLKCKTETKYEEKFSFLVLALPCDEKSKNQLDIRDLIKNYFTAEELTVNNQFKCQNCDTYQDGIRQVFLVEAPEYLNLTLTRFAYNRKNMKRSKIMTHVDYPKEICLKCFNSDNHVGEEINYVLCSIVIHSGYHSDSGHCTLLSRHSALFNEHYSNASDLLKDSWYMFNDESVNKIEFKSSQTLKFSSEKTPYFFMYRRVSKELLESKELRYNLEELLAKSVIPEKFQNEIMKDNEIYFKEKFSRISEEESAKKKKGDFDYDGSGNGGGTNAFGHLDIFGSKFIY